MPHGMHAGTLKRYMVEVVHVIKRW